MSTLLGILQLTGRGGNELFVYDDALVRAATGLGAALLGALDSSSTAGVEAIARAFAGQDANAGLAPVEIAAQATTNVLVWQRDVAAAALTRGRWPSTGLRRFTLTLRSDTTFVWSWPGDGATRPLNHDAYATSLLRQALPDLAVVLT